MYVVVFVSVFAVMAVFVIACLWLCLWFVCFWLWLCIVYCVSVVMLCGRVLRVEVRQGTQPSGAGEGGGGEGGGRRQLTSNLTLT